MRDLITTAFEVAGLLLLVVAGGLFVAHVIDAPAGLAMAGVLSLGCSALIVYRSKPPKSEGSEIA